MEKKDIALIEKYIEKDGDLKKLYEEHLDLEKKLEVYGERRYLSPEEEIEKAKLKKIKLKGRDQIEQKLSQYRGLEYK